MLAGHDRASEVDRRNAVIGLFGEFLDGLVAAADADPDIIVQDVDAAPTLDRSRHCRGEGRLARNVGLKRDTLAALAGGQCRGLLYGAELAIYREDRGAFLCEAQYGGTAVADTLAWALPGADDDGDFTCEAHDGPPRRTLGAAFHKVCGRNGASDRIRTDDIQIHNLAL